MLAVEDGMAMKRYRVIIPTVLQKEILTNLHAAHQETEKQSSGLRQDKHSEKVFYYTFFVTFFKLVCLISLINNSLQYAPVTKPLAGARGYRLEREIERLGTTYHAALNDCHSQCYFVD